MCISDRVHSLPSCVWSINIATDEQPCSSLLVLWLSSSWIASMQSHNCVLNNLRVYISQLPQCCTSFVLRWYGGMLQLSAVVAFSVPGSQYLVGGVWMTSLSSFATTSQCTYPAYLHSHMEMSVLAAPVAISTVMQMACVVC